MIGRRVLAEDGQEYRGALIGYLSGLRPAEQADIPHTWEAVLNHSISLGNLSSEETERLLSFTDVVLFDFLICNCDRKFIRNWFIHRSSGQFVALDNGLAFEGVLGDGDRSAPVFACDHLVSETDIEEVLQVEQLPLSVQGDDHLAGSISQRRSVGLAMLRCPPIWYTDQTLGETDVDRLRRQLEALRGEKLNGTSSERPHLQRQELKQQPRVCHNARAAFCRFRRSTAEWLWQMGTEGTFVAQLRHRLSLDPLGLESLLSPRYSPAIRQELFSILQGSLALLLYHIKQCVAQFGEAAVFIADGGVLAFI